MSRLVVRTAVALAVLAGAGCAATMNVSSHVQAGVDFSRYRTFDWGPADGLPVGDPRLDDNALFQDRVQGAIERTLALKGLEREEAGGADLLIHYHASVSQRLDVNRLDREQGYCADEDCRGRVVEFEAGTLVLDVVDASTNRVIWRGWSQQQLDDLLGDDDRMRRTIEAAVGRMLNQLPVGTR